jgi:putative DNA primase/helicase
MPAMEEAYEGKEVDRLKLKHALISGSMPRRMAMIASAGYEHPAFTNINDWDSDGWLFNCENGVIDLRNQTFRGRTPSDLCMKQSPIVFDPDAQCPLWEAAMNKWMCGDQSLVDYLQVAWGVTLTSDTGLQALFFNQGDGENGKDTAFSVISYILGTYWQNVLRFPPPLSKTPLDDSVRPIAIPARADRLLRARRCCCVRLARHSTRR